MPYDFYCRFAQISGPNFPVKKSRIPPNSGEFTSLLNQALFQKNTDATKNFIDSGQYFCVGRSKNFKVFPLSNQSTDHTLEAVDRTQWKLTAGVWTA
jgi:hypothetical protein